MVTINPFLRSGDDQLNFHSQSQQTLTKNNLEYLRTLQTETEFTHGVKSKDRGLDPSMNQIFSWGYEAPV